MVSGRSEAVEQLAGRGAVDWLLQSAREEHGEDQAGRDSSLECVAVSSYVADEMHNAGYVDEQEEAAEAAGGEDSQDCNTMCRGSQVWRDEGKISRKLMECINTYLTKDGPNLGCQAIEIHHAVQEFMFQCWLTTHDRELKNSFVVYARLQLKLNRSMPEGSAVIEQVLDVVTKELDQCAISCTSSLLNDTSRDDKAGSFGSSQQGLMDLAAAVFYQACTNSTKISHQEKRLKMEHAAVRVKDGLMKGLWLWSVLYFISCYFSRKGAQGVGPNIAISFYVYEILRSRWQLESL